MTHAKHLFRQTHKLIKLAIVLCKVGIHDTGARATSQFRTVPQVLRCWVNGFILLFLLLIGSSGSAQQQPQPLQSFGYVDLLPFPGDDQLNPRKYADWAFVLTDPPAPGGIVNLVSTLQTLHGNAPDRPLKAYIDLGGLLWQKVADNPLQYAAYPDYQNRWKTFRLQHIVTNSDGSKTDYLSPTYVMAYNVIGEPTLLNVPLTDVEAVARYIKEDACDGVIIRCYGTPNSVVEFVGDAAFPKYTALADYIDWWGVDVYGVHPASLDALTRAMANFKQMENNLAHSQKKLLYDMDGWWDAPTHQCVAPHPADMAGIAQEWFNVAGSDPDAILLGVFAFNDLVATGSLNLPRNVLDKQAQIGLEIRNHLLPAYQGNLDGADCQAISGWAWDSNQPDVSVLGTPDYKNPVYVDFFADGLFFKRAAAQDFRQDLKDNGKGNGSHGFNILTPDYVKDGGQHSLSVRVSGTNGALPGRASTLSCSSPSFASITQLSYGQVGVPYSQSIWGGGNPTDYLFSVAGGQGLVPGQLPPGLTVDASGILVGIPTTAGEFFLRVTAIEKRPESCDSIAAFTLRTYTKIFSVIVQCGGTACPPQYEGYNDGSNPSEISGWAWDKIQPNTTAQVDIYDSAADVVPSGTPLLARVNANLFRQDLLDAGKGDGNHGFEFTLPSALKDGNPHRFHVTFAGTKTELTWSPRVVVPSSGRFVGSHSTNTCDRIDGYALDNWQSNTPIDVNIFDNGTLLASLVANYDGTAVPATAGKGTHGFLYYTPDRLKDGNRHEINITFRLSGQQLSHTDKALVCPAAHPPSIPAWEGWFDNVTCERVDGWGWDATRPNTPVDMALFADGTRVATLTANYFSQDLLTAGKGNGAHRFLYYLPDFLRDGAQHHVTAQIVGQDADLPISSNITDGFVTCTAVPTPVAPPPPSVAITSSGSSVYGQSASFIVRVDGPGAGPAPTGTVTFLDGSHVLGTAVMDSFAQASLNTSALSTGTHTIAASYSGDFIFPASSGQVVQVVSPSSLLVAAANASRPYGAVNPVFTGTLTGLQNNDTITATFQSAATAASPVGTYAITAVLSDSGGKLGNYTVTAQNGVLSVPPAPLQVTANNKTRMYGDPNPAFDGTVTGIRNADNIQAQYATTANTQSLVGTYPITATLSDPNGKLGNYSVTLQNGTLTVTRSNVALANPVFSPSSGVYSPGQTVTLTEPTSSAAAIHYTADGTTPTAASPLYTGPIMLNAGSTTLKAMATQSEYTDSGVSTAGYFIRIPISETLASQTILGCGSASYTVSVSTVNSLSGSSIALSISGLPTGATASFSPSSIGSPGSSTLTVTPSSSTPPGTYSLTITGSAGSFTGSSTVTLVVQDFAVSVTSPPPAVTACEGASYAVSTTANNGFAGSVALSMSGLPVGASATFSPTSITGSGASTLIVTTSASTPVGTYSLILAASSGCRVKTLPLTLVVNAPPPSGPNIASLSPIAGPVGTAVSISGSNFGATQGSSTVTFNGTVAPVTAWSAGSISTSVPRGAKTGNVVVTAGGTASNGVSFTVQDDAVHIFGTNCSTCGWQITDFTIQTSSVYGYTIRSGDILYFYQWQNTSSIAGIEVCFPGGEGVSCADNGLTVDQDNKPVHADTITGVTHFRRVDLSPNAGQTLSQISFHSHGSTKAGRWDVYFSNIQIVSADGSVRSIFVTGSTPGLFVSTSFGVTGVGSAIEHNHVW